MNVLVSNYKTSSLKKYWYYSNYSKYIKGKVCLPKYITRHRIFISLSEVCDEKIFISVSNRIVPSESLLESRRSFIKFISQEIVGVVCSIGISVLMLTGFILLNTKTKILRPIRSTILGKKSRYSTVHFDCKLNNNLIKSFSSMHLGVEEKKFDESAVMF